MRMFQRMKLNQKGLSMVELICAVAILTVLGTAVSGVLVVSAHSYRQGSAETEVQQEAQLVANQISDLIIDSTSEVKYEGNKLTIMQKDNSGYEINYYSSSSELKYKEKYVTGTYSEEQLLADGVTKFSVVDTNFKKNGSIQMSITISEGANSYPAVFAITQRNAVPDGATAEAATARISSSVRRWLLEPNQSCDFAPYVTVPTGDTVSWTVENSNPAGSSAMNGSKLEVGKEEKATSLKVKATCSSGSSVYITVYIRRVTGIVVNGALAEGDEYKNGSKYSLLSLFSGSSLNQITGATFDSDYVDTRTVEYIVSGGSNQGKAHIDSSNRLVLDDDLAAGEDVIVQAIAKHPAGVNKSHLQYGTVVGTWTLKNELTFNPWNIDMGDDGWLRFSDQKQATTSNTSLENMIAAMQAIDPVKYANLNANKHHFKVSYRPVGSTGAWTELSYAETRASGAEGFGSNAINMRPIISGRMDPLLDYDVKITWGMYEGDDPNTETDIYSFTFGQMVRHVSFAVESEYFPDAKLGWSRYEAPVLNRLSKGETLFAVVGDLITGVETRNSIEGNHMYYYLERSVDNGVSWSDYNPVKRAFGAEGQFEFDITEAGLYRTRVYYKPELKSGESVTGFIDYDGAKVVDLSNEGSGEAIYYFVIDPTGTPTEKKYKKLYKVSKGGSWNDGTADYVQYNITLNDLSNGKIIAIPYAGTLDAKPSLNGANFDVDYDDSSVYFTYKGNNTTETMYSITFKGNSFMLK